MKSRSDHGTMPLSRREFVCGSAALLAAPAQLAQQLPGGTHGLRRVATQAGVLLGMFTVAWELLKEPPAGATIADNFSLIADGNDFKFANQLRPTPTTFDFSYSDAAITWAEQHRMLFRAHCLVWWNALPDWFATYVTRANALQLMTDHINSVVGRYAGRVYSWDVVNEPIEEGYRSDGLRTKPWVELIGPNYTDSAFRTAHAADPKARLVLNECYIEHDTPMEIKRRASFLALATRLKNSGVPLTAIGVQGHLRGNTPLDKTGLVTFFKQVHDLGLEVMITEMDVDDLGVPVQSIDQTVASKYGEFLDLAGPYVKVITFEQLRDDPSLPKRPDGFAHRPNLFDEAYQPTQAYKAVVTTLANNHAALSANQRQ